MNQSFKSSSDYRIASMRPFAVKLLFHFTCRLLLQSSIELVASCYVRPVFASNELLSVLASFARHPMLYSPKGNPVNARGPEGGTHIDRLARLISELFHLVLYRWASPRSAPRISGKGSIHQENDGLIKTSQYSQKVRIVSKSEQLFSTSRLAQDSWQFSFTI